MLLLPKVIDRGIVSVTCTTNEAVCRRRMAVALRGGYGWHQRYWNGLREKRRRLTLSACCRRRRSRRLHVLHLRRIYNSRERGRLHRGRPSFECMVAGGTSVKEACENAAGCCSSSSRTCLTTTSRCRRRPSARPAVGAVRGGGRRFHSRELVHDARGGGGRARRVPRPC